jgi:hypothetical protein
MLETPNEEMEHKNLFRVQLDSHADTCCVGYDVLIVNTMEETARVTPFLKSIGSVSKVPTVTAAIAYNDMKTGEVTVLLIHQGLYFKENNNCLLCSIQARMNDVKLKEQLKFLTEANSKGSCFSD